MGVFTAAAGEHPCPAQTLTGALPLLEQEEEEGNITADAGW